jgi:hypothetical protein
MEARYVDSMGEIMADRTTMLRRALGEAFSTNAIGQYGPRLDTGQAMASGRLNDRPIRALRNGCSKRSRHASVSCSETSAKPAARRLFSISVSAAAR